MFGRTRGAKARNEWFSFGSVGLMPQEGVSEDSDPAGRSSLDAPRGTRNARRQGAKQQRVGREISTVVEVLPIDRTGRRRQLDR